LAFVLLVIFIITTTPVVNDLDVDLPSAARRAKDPKSKVNYITVNNDGTMYLNNQQVDLASLHEKLVGLRLDDPDLNVTLRGSSRTKYHHIVDVMDILQQAQVGKVDLATEPAGGPVPQKE